MNVQIETKIGVLSQQMNTFPDIRFTLLSWLKLYQVFSVLHNAQLKGKGELI